VTAARLLPSALALLAFCVAAEGVQQVSFKVGVARAEGAASAIRGVLLQPLIWAGISIWVMESIAWVLVLQKSPISVAYPVMTLTYATVPLVGVLVLRERMSRRQMMGAALIFSGVLLVGLAGA